eukprot:4225424-Prymnesium_polylepis.1
MCIHPVQGWVTYSVTQVLKTREWGTNKHLDVFPCFRRFKKHPELSCLGQIALPHPRMPNLATFWTVREREIAGDRDEIEMRLR